MADIRNAHIKVKVGLAQTSSYRLLLWSLGKLATQQLQIIRLKAQLRARRACSLYDSDPLDD